jgi:GTP-binding protein
MANLSVKNIKFANNTSFVLGAANYSQIPVNSFLQVAFWGRSNVGKSSLLNALTNNSKTAKVSNTPGRTQQINFFSIKDLFYVVDLPGYGHSKMGKELHYRVNKLVERYMKDTSNLLRIYLLIDSKIGFKEIDFAVMEFLNFIGKSYQIVFTKIDRNNKSQTEVLLDSFNNILPNNPACFIKPLFVSSKNKTGIAELEHTILKTVSI